MTAWLLDTNVIAEVAGRRSDANVLKWLLAQPESALHLSILSFGEYQKGIAHLPTDDALRLRIEEQLAALRRRFLGRIIGIDEQTMLIWGTLSNRVKRHAGHPPPVIDALFAAQAVQHNLTLATRNIRDVQHTGVTVLNPWS